MLAALAAALMSCGTQRKELISHMAWARNTLIWKKLRNIFGVSALNLSSKVFDFELDKKRAVIAHFDDGSFESFPVIDLS